MEFGEYVTRAQCQDGGWYEVRYDTEYSLPYTVYYYEREECWEFAHRLVARFNWEGDAQFFIKEASRLNRIA